MAALKKMLMNESSPATTQVTVWSRSTGMPSIAARSRRSPVARMAIPRSVRVNHTATPPRQASETTAAIR